MHPLGCHLYLFCSPVSLFKYGIIDPWFNLFIFLSIYSLFEYIQCSGRWREVGWSSLSAALLGLAILTKGPVVLGSRILGKGALKGGMPIYKYISNRILAQILFRGYEIGEITCPANYFEVASTINLRRSITYGIGVEISSLSYWLAKWNIYKSVIFRQL
ncbi:hypothetical protein ACFLS7_03550 [Bacteroidota bacterium]